MEQLTFHGSFLVLVYSHLADARDVMQVAMGDTPWTICHMPLKKWNLDTISYCNTLKSSGQGVSDLCGAVSKDKFPPLHYLFSQGISDTSSGHFPHDNCCSISLCWDQQGKSCYLREIKKGLAKLQDQVVFNIYKNFRFLKAEKNPNNNDTILHISLRKSSK